VVNDNGLTFAAATVGGNLAATATAGNMTDNGALAITGTTRLTTSANNATIALDTTTNAFTGAVTITTNDSSGTDADVTIDGGTTALILAASTIDGDLTVRSGNASGITDSGTLTVGGNLAATTDAANGLINLGTLAVDGTIALATNGSGNATVVNDAGLAFAASTVGGNLSATATTGNVTQWGALSVTGTSSYTTSANNAYIALSYQTNAFTGAVSLNTTGSDGFARIDGGTTALDIAASSVGGWLMLTSGHASGITDSGTVTVGGNLIATTDANSGVITMDGLRVDGTVQLTTHGSGDATVVNDAGLTFLASTVRNLAATATTGDIVDSGVLTVAGTSSFTTSANNADITLNNTNALTGTVALNTSGSTGHALVDNGITALNLAASSVGGNLTLTSGHASGIIDSSTVTVGGNLVATTDAANGVITMDGLRVDGTVQLTTHGSGDATVVNDAGLTFLASTVRNLAATATTGNIVDSGVLTVAGTLHSPPVRTMRTLL